MMNYTIYGNKMSSRDEAHAEIARALEFPDYYGKNLDALWDMLTSMDADVTMVNVSAMLRALGAYGCKILSTFYDAMEENDGLTLTIGEDQEDDFFGE